MRDRVAHCGPHAGGGLLLLAILLVGGMGRQDTSAAAGFPRQRHRLSRGLTGSAATAAAACPVHPVPVPLPVEALESGNLSDALASLKSLAADNVGKPGAPEAVAYRIQYRDQVLLSGAAGLADLATSTPATEHTKFRIGSVSKVFAALLAFVLASQGRLSLDDPVVKYCPEFAVKDPWDSSDGKTITFRHLIGQRSGIQRELPWQYYNDTKSVLTYLATTYLIAPAGSTPPSYSNLAFGVLGHVLAEFVVGGDATFPDLVAQYITKPLGMANTGFYYTPEILSELAKPYAGGQELSFYPTSWAYPSGSMYSTVQDLTTLAHAIMNAATPQSASLSPRLDVNPALARELLDPDFIAPDEASFFGLPWEESSADTYLILNKGGNIPGYTALLSFVPDLQLSVSLVWNAGMDEFDVSQQVYSMLLPPLVQSLLPLQPSPSRGPNAADYLGTYNATAPHIPSVTVLVYQDKLLWASPGIASVFMDWIEEDAFRAYIPPGTLPCLSSELQAIANQTITFRRNAQGLVYYTSFWGVAPLAEWTRDV